MFSESIVLLLIFYLLFGKYLFGSLIGAIFF